MAQKIKAILLVDDDPDDRFLFREALSEADNSILYLSASNGIDAIEKLDSGTIVPDLLFMDVNMPKMNGLDCLKELQQSEKFRHVPVIMYSTSCSLEFQKKCFDHGAADYIEKPNDFRQLRTVLERILGKGTAFSKNDMPVKL